MADPIQDLEYCGGAEGKKQSNVRFTSEHGRFHNGIAARLVAHGRRCQMRAASLTGPRDVCVASAGSMGRGSIGAAPLKR